MKKTSILLILLFIISAFSVSAAETGIVRYALFIGSNTGGFNRVPLEYAVSDARAFAAVLYEMGGLNKSNSILLSNPDLEEIYEGFETAGQMILEMQGSARRTEFIIYYSGHSDETGLLLGNEVLYYKELRELINGTGADVNIAILDSCSSGTFTRMKGAIREAPFLVDESNETSGHAYITSSSADEAAQESDAIQASYFTHYLISALRGAADNTQDGVITIHEAYAYASSETQSKTQYTQAGTQHPSYDMNLSGSGGELVLTDLRSTTAGMVFEEALEGRIYIKDYSGRLVLEAGKLAGKSISIALPPGMYYVTLSDPQNRHTYQEAVVQLGFNDKRTLAAADFEDSEKLAARSRGVDIEKIEDDRFGDLKFNLGDFLSPLVGFIDNLNLPDYSSFSINFIPSTNNLTGFGFGLMNFNARNVNGFQWALLGNVNGGNIGGFQLSSIYNINSGNVHGGQGTGIFNINGGENQGFQGAGVFNINGKSTSGFQGAGVFNINSGHAYGFQGAGVFNINEEDFKGFQGAGVFNINAGGGTGFQGAGVFNINKGPLKGVQASAVFNTADNFAGVQLSTVNIASNFQGVQLGVVNIANEVSGTQVGVVNINKDISGIPIGLVNISSDGLHNFSLWFAENGDLYTGFQLGTKNLYTLFFAGVNPKEFGTDNIVFSGIGAGLRIPIKGFFIETDLSIKQYVQGENPADALVSSFGLSLANFVLPSLRLNAGLKIGKLALFTGISLDIYMPDGLMPMPSFYPHTEVWPLEFSEDFSLELYPNIYFGIQL